jgi:hypothetical protein
VKRLLAAGTSRPVEVEDLSRAGDDRWPPLDPYETGLAPGKRHHVLGLLATAERF